MDILVCNPWNNGKSAALGVGDLNTSFDVKMLQWCWARLLGSVDLIHAIKAILSYYVKVFGTTDLFPGLLDWLIFIEYMYITYSIMEKQCGKADVVDLIFR